MEREFTRNELWNTAGLAGLGLGAISAAYTLITTLLSQPGSSSIMTMILTFLLWGLKFGGCIWLMYFFMKKIHRSYAGADRTRLFRFGAAAALCSALIAAGFTLANILIISPEAYRTAIETTISSVASTLDSNSLAVLDKTLSQLPVYSFFSVLIYCFLYGLVLSAILSRAIAPDNPFEGQQDNL